MKIAVISDIHEDIVSLEKAMNLIAKKSCNEIVCLGDIVGFAVPYYSYLSTRNANACIRLVASNARYSVVGNHDHYAIRKTPQRAGTFEFPNKWYTLPFSQRLALAQGTVWLYENNELSALIDDESSCYIDLLPEYQIIETGGIKIFISHFLAPDLTGALTAFFQKPADYILHYQLCEQHGCGIALFGHMHLQACGVVQKNNFELVQIKKTGLSKNHGIAIPAIATGNSRNGFAIIDTQKLTIETVYLNSSIQLLKNFSYEQ